MPTAECSLPFDELRHEEKAIFQQTRGRKFPVPPFVIYTFLRFPYFSGGTSWQILEHRLCIVKIHVGFTEGCLMQPLPVEAWKSWNTRVFPPIPCRPCDCEGNHANLLPPKNATWDLGFMPLGPHRNDLG